MVTIVIQGINGRMGKVLYDLIKQRKDCKIIAGIDSSNDTQFEFPIFKSAFDISVPVDILIDFSHPNATKTALQACAEKQIPCVICTTGLPAETLSLLKETAKQIPVFYSANMSIGINLLISLAKQAASLLPNFDIEIIEKHHRNKLDAPSGTALMIADAINTVENPPYNYQYNREPLRQVRPNNEIGIHSIRGGTIVGEHEVLFAGPDELISLSHYANSRAIFANGAIQAALFLKQCGIGHYSMEDLIQKTLQEK